MRNLLKQAEATWITATGSLTLMEVELMMKDEDIKAALAALDLVVPDPWRFFMLLDLNGNGEVTEDEFVEGCLRLRGPARTFDVASLTEENLRMKAKLVTLEEQQEGSARRVCKAAQESNLTHMRTLLAEISPGGPFTAAFAG